jgi:hypothetical protein
VKVNVPLNGMAFHARWVVATALAVLAVACGAAEEEGFGRPALQAERLPGVGATFPVGERDVAGVAVGERAVWVGTWDHHAAPVWRIDPQRNEVVAAIAVEDVQGVAAGEGAVWVVGGTCVAPLPEDPDVCRLDPWVARIDPRTNRVVATIPLDRPPGIRSADLFPLTSWVAAGEGGVWVAVGWDSWTGEVVRIDPQTNEVVARIDAHGHPGEVAVGAGSVWGLSDLAFTDESFGASRSTGSIPARTRSQRPRCARSCPTSAAPNTADARGR